MFERDKRTRLYGTYLSKAVKFEGLSINFHPFRVCCRGHSWATASLALNSLNAKGCSLRDFAKMVLKKGTRWTREVSKGIREWHKKYTEQPLGNATEQNYDECDNTCLYKGDR